MRLSKEMEKCNRKALEGNLVRHKKKLVHPYRSSFALMLIVIMIITNIIPAGGINLREGFSATMPVQAAETEDNASEENSQDMQAASGKEELSEEEKTESATDKTAENEKNVENTNNAENVSDSDEAASSNTEKSKKEKETDDTPKVFTAKTKDGKCKITVTADKYSGLTGNENMIITEVSRKEKLYKKARKKLNSTLVEDLDGQVLNLCLYDISFTDQNGDLVHLKRSVKVTITYPDRYALKTGKDDTVRAFTVETIQNASLLSQASLLLSRTGEKAAAKSVRSNISEARRTAANGISTIAAASTAVVENPDIGIRKTAWVGDHLTETKIINYKLKEITYDLEKDGLTGIAVIGQEKKEAAQTGKDEKTTEQNASTQKENQDQTGTDQKAGSEKEQVDVGANVNTDAEKNTGADEKTDAGRTLTASSSDYKVTVSYDEAAKLPKDARLFVLEKADYTRSYKNYLSQVESALKDKGEIDTARFFDIKILDGQGNKLEPADSVKVSIEFASMSLKDKDNLDIIHFKEEKTGADQVAPEIVDGVTLMDGDNKNTIDGLSFETDGFSVYGVIYTVDFHWGDYTYNLQGGSTLLLSELLHATKKLAEIAADMSRVEKVKFSNPELLKVEKATNGDGEQTDDWLLTSLQAFDTDEELTLVLTDGSEIVIHVTDEQVASGTTSNGIAWSLDSDGLLTINYTGTGSAILSDLPWIDHKTSVKKVIMTGNIVAGSVDKWFDGYSNLTEVSFPSTLNFIPWGSCQNCTSLQTVNFSDLMAATEIRQNAFYGCTNLVLNVSDLSSMTSLTTIGTSAFHSDSKVTGTLSGLNSLQTIGQSAFERTGITTVDFSGNISLTTVGSAAFYQCESLANIDFSGCTSLTGIPDNTFQNCKNVKSVDISNTGISSLTFLSQVQGSLETLNIRNCTGLTNVDISAYKQLKKLYISAPAEGKTLTIKTGNNSNLSIYFDGSKKELDDLITAKAIVITGQPKEIVPNTEGTITIKANTVSKVYDGKPLSLVEGGTSSFVINSTDPSNVPEGFTFTYIASDENNSDGNSLPDGYKITVELKDSLTDVSDSPVTVKPQNVKVENDRGDDVTNTYSIEYESGSLSVTPLPITISSNGEKVYGDEDPDWSISLVSVGIDNAADDDSLRAFVEQNIKKLPFEVTRKGGENVGTYETTVTVSDYESNGWKNYTVTPESGVFTIKPASVTVTANDLIWKLGETKPDLTAKITGLKNGDIQPSINYEKVSDGTRKVVVRNSDDRDPVLEFTLDCEFLKSEEQQPETGASYPIIVRGNKVVGINPDVIDAENTAGTGSNIEKQGNYEVTFINGTLTVPSKYIARVRTGSGDASNSDSADSEWKEFEYLSGDDRTTSALAYAKELTGDVIIELLFPKDERLDFTSAYVFSDDFKCDNLTIRTADGVDRSTLSYKNEASGQEENTSTYLFTWNRTGGKFTLENLVVDGGNKVGGVNVKKGSLVLGEGACLQNGSVIGNGGGVYAAANTIVEINGGEITNCRATRGGGIYVDKNAKLTGINGSIIGNTADTGGGIFIAENNQPNKANNNKDNGKLSDDEATPQISISKLTISDNTANINGGGMYISTYRRASISNVTMAGNRAAGTKSSDSSLQESGTGNGGAIYVDWATDVVISDSTIGSEDSPNIAGEAVVYNENAKNHGIGGGIYLYSQAGRTWPWQAANVTLTNVNVSYNKAVLGGGIGTKQHSRLTVEGDNNKILNNSASVDGGGIYLQGSNTVFSMVNAEVSGNTAAGSGGGIYSSTSGDISALLSNVTITGNQANRGGGGYAPNVSMRNVTVSGNTVISNSISAGAGFVVTGKLTLGEAGAEKDQTRIENNHLSDKDRVSNLCLNYKTTSDFAHFNNKENISLLCPFEGKLWVSNPGDGYTKFGIAGGRGFLTNPQNDNASSEKLVEEANIATDDESYMIGRMDTSDSNSVHITWWKRPVAKITDKEGNLLYYKSDDDYIPAIFTQLSIANENTHPESRAAAFTSLNMEDPALHIKKDTGYDKYQEKNYCVKMLDDYVLRYMISLNTEDKKITFTTAGTNAEEEDGYPYTGDSKDGIAVIYQKYVLGETTNKSNQFMISTHGKTELTLKNITIDGGAVFRNGKVIKSSSVISPNDGAFVNLYGQSTFILGSGATLQNGYTETDSGSSHVFGGAAIAHGNVANGSTVIMKEGSRIYRCGINVNGGAISAQNGANSQTIIEGGIIEECWSDMSGGAVYIGTGNTFTMTGGTITGNTAPLGAACYIANGSTFNMSGGEIVNNTSSKYSESSANPAGGAVACGSSAKLNFSGTPVVYANFNSETEKQQNVFLNYDSNEIINATGLTSKGSVNSIIGIYVIGDTNESKSMFGKHGQKNMPFGTYSDEANLAFFVNDRLASLCGGKGDTGKQIVWVPAETINFPVTKNWTINGEKLASDDERLKNRTVYFELYQVSGGSGVDTHGTDIPPQLVVSYDKVWPEQELSKLNNENRNDPAFTFKPTGGFFYYQGKFYIIFKDFSRNIAELLDSGRTPDKIPFENYNAGVTWNGKFIDYDAFIAEAEKYNTNDSGKVYEVNQAIHNTANAVPYNEYFTAEWDGNKCKFKPLSTVDRGSIVKFKNEYYVIWNYNGSVFEQWGVGSVWYKLQPGTGTGSGGSPIINYITQEDAENEKGKLSNYDVETVTSDTSSSGADNHGTGTVEYKYMGSNGQTVTIEDVFTITANDQNWTKIITNLDASCSYYVVERMVTDVRSGETINMPPRSGANEGIFNVRYGYTQDGSSVVITNDMDNTDINVGFRKIDGFGNGLNGASFSLHDSYTYAVDTSGKAVESWGDIVPVATEEFSETQTEVTSRTIADTDGTVIFAVGPGVYYMQETAAPAGYDKSNAYILLVGNENLDGAGENPRTGLWAADGVLSNITKEMVVEQQKARRTRADNASGLDRTGEVAEDDRQFAIFRLKEGKAVGGAGNNYVALSGPKIGQLGLMNVSTRSRKVIMKKVLEENYEALSGGTFNIYAADLSVVNTGISAADGSGIMFFDTLPYGTYYLEEEEVPSGADASNAGRVYTIIVSETGVSISDASGNISELATAFDKERRIDIPEDSFGGSGSGSGSVTGNNKKLTGLTIQLNPGSDQYKVNDIVTATLTATYSDGTSESYPSTKATWGSSSETVLSIDGNGIITCRNQGMATITATAGGKTARTSLNVIGDKLDSIAINPSSIRGIVGGNQTITVTGHYTISGDKSVNGAVISVVEGNDDVISITEGNKINFLKEGSARIKAEYEDKTAECTVTVVKAGVLTLTYTGDTPMKYGDMISPSDIEVSYVGVAKNLNEIWSNVNCQWSDASKVSWYGYDNIKFLGTGDITLTITINNTWLYGETAYGATGSITFTVGDKVETKLNTTSLSGQVGGTGTVSVTYKVNDQDLSSQVAGHLSYQSSDEAVAKVVDGVVQYVAVGNAQVEVSFDGESLGLVQINVIERPQEQEGNLFVSIGDDAISLPLGYIASGNGGFSDEDKQKLIDGGGFKQGEIYIVGSTVKFCFKNDATENTIRYNNGAALLDLQGFTYSDGELKYNGTVVNGNDYDGNGAFNAGYGSIVKQSSNYYVTISTNNYFAGRLKCEEHPEAFARIN